MKRTASRKHRTLCLILASLFLLNMVLLVGSPVVMAEEVDFVYVSDLPCSYWSMIQSASDNPASPYSPSFNSNERGETLRIAGISYAKGLRTHPDENAPALFVYDIGELGYKYFSATVGKDSLGGEGLVRFTVCVDDKEVISSRDLNFGESDFIQCSVEGGQKLSLYVYNVDGYSCDSAAWGSPRLSMERLTADTGSGTDTPTDPTDVYDPERDDYKGDYQPVYNGTEEEIFVSDLKWKNWQMYQAHSGQASPIYQPSFNCNEAGNTIVINGVAYEKGIRTHPDAETPADIVYDISEYSNKYQHFVATVGRDSASDGPGYVRFQILVDGKLVAETADLTNGEDALICADIQGGKTLTLRVDPTSDSMRHDSSAWGNARLCNMAIESVTLENAPSKLNYVLGDSLDLTGCTVKVTYETGYTLIEEVDMTMLSGYDMNTPGKQTVTVTAYGTTFSFDIHIKNLAVETAPAVTEPEVTEPEVTEPEVTEPEVTEPEDTEPDVTGSENTESDLPESATDGETDNGTTDDGNGCASLLSGACMILLLPAAAFGVARKREEHGH